MELYIPEVLEGVGTLSNLQLPDPQLYNYYKNLDERKIWIDYDISSENVLDVTKNIIQWNKEDKDKPVEDRTPIRLYIFSMGGEVDATLNVANVCELSKTPVYTYNMGVSMSGGLLILLSGSKRFCLDGSRAMVHSGSGGIAGTGEQVEAAAKDYQRQIKYMHEYVMRRTGMSAKTFSKYKSKDWFLNAQEQIDFGMAHKIITDIDDIL